VTTRIAVIGLCVSLVIAGSSVILLDHETGTLIPTSRCLDDGAVVYLPQRQLDLGSVTFQEERDIKFEVVNMGKRRLVINEIDSDCGCGEPVRRTVVIPSGEVGHLSVGIDTRFAIGEIRKQTSFTTNDPVQPRFELLVKASVQPTENPHSSLDQRQQVSVLVHR